MDPGKEARATWVKNPPIAPCCSQKKIKSFLLAFPPIPTSAFSLWPPSLGSGRCLYLECLLGERFGPVHGDFSWVPGILCLP